MLALTAGAYERHNSLAVDLYRPVQKAWVDGLGFDAQMGGWFTPRTVFAIGIGALILQPDPQALRSYPVAAPAEGVDPSGLLLLGKAPSFMLGPSVWLQAPMTEIFAISGELGARYAFNPHGPTAIGQRAIETGEIVEYSEIVELDDGFVGRASLHLEVLLRQSAVGFAGVVWQQTLAGYEATLGGSPIGEFDVDGMVLRVGFRGNW